MADCVSNVAKPAFMLVVCNSPITPMRYKPINTIISLVFFDLGAIVF